MINQNKQSKASIIPVAKSLADLVEQFVFVGGAVTGLLVTDPAAAEARFTKDVDITSFTSSLTEFYKIGIQEI